MRLTVVGCSGSYPGPDSAASCYLVEADDGDRTWRLVLDLGNGALGALHRYADPLTIDAVLLSHLHADHCIDITSYYVLRKYHPHGEQPPIPVHGPDGTPGRLARAYDLPKSPGMTEEFTFHFYPAGPFEIGPFSIEAVEVRHPVPAYALRLTADGRTLAYSGDTGVCDALVRVARDSDLFLCEASFTDGKEDIPGLHLNGREAGEYARAAGAARLVLTHIPPWTEPQDNLRDAKAAFGGPVELAHPRAVYEI
jgi:ribonuclease BN (tRNA processing enzyme)